MNKPNVVVMIPFCRTLEEADRVLAEMGRHGLRRGKGGLQVYVMAEIPSNVVLASQFATHCRGRAAPAANTEQAAWPFDAVRRSCL